MLTILLSFFVHDDYHLMFLKGYPASIQMYGEPDCALHDKYLSLTHIFHDRGRQHHRWFALSANQ